VTFEKKKKKTHTPEKVRETLYGTLGKKSPYSEAAGAKALRKVQTRMPESLELS
jgi:hypothetical protein